MKTAADLAARLQQLHPRTAETPIFNPVFQLGLELSRALESGAMTLADAAGLVAELECESLMSRAERLASLLTPVDPAANRASLEKLAAESPDFSAFAARWNHPLFHVVFTAHPTFLLPPAQTEAVVAAASSGAVSAETVCIVAADRHAITLDFEHDSVIAALSRAQDARDAMVLGLLEVAARRWPDQWRTLK
ncbi:MAG: phosphoenolpyruvate carboxylase, partial [Novosphingobium sp.]